MVKPGVLLLSLGMVAMGALHLARPAPFVNVMPDYLPAPTLLVALSGILEIAGGLGLLLPAIRKWAGWGLAALFMAVFPANVDMALHGAFGLPPWLLWSRLPFQIPLVLWAVWAARQKIPSIQ